MSFLNNLLHYLVVGGMKDKFDFSEFKVVYKSNKDLTELEIKSIINLKSQYWNYSYDMQRSWMNKNLNENDFHLWIENSSHEIIAYMNHVFVECFHNDKLENMIGIGNVCVSPLYTSRGLGKLLMHISSFYISENSLNAILLCKDDLRSFYLKSGWKLFEGNVLINSEEFDKNLFALHEIQASALFLNRNF